MKKTAMAFTCMFILTGAGLFAGSLDYLSNQSAKWVMTTSRNASLDGADIIQYNPAGTAWLPMGWHLDFSGQTLLKYYNNENTSVGNFSGPASPLSPLLSRSAETLSQDYPSPIVPNMYLAYNLGEIGKGKFAAYMQAGVVAGGGELKWKNGTAGTTLLLTGISAAAGGAPGLINSQDFTASSTYYGIGIGASYAFPGDKVSVSLGGRAVMAKRSFDLKAAFSAPETLTGGYEYKATGFTPIVGLNVKPNKDITLTARFEAPTALEFEYKQKELGGSLAAVAAAVLTSVGIEDGKKTRQDLPAVIGLGAGYVKDKFAFDVSGTIFLLDKANFGYVYEGGDTAGEVNDYFSTGWDLGFGATYKVRNDLKIGAGATYTEAGINDSYMNDSKTALNASANSKLDSIAVGSGITYTIMGDLDFTLSFLWSHNFPKSFSLDSGAFTVSGKYTNDVVVIGYGVSYNF